MKKTILIALTVILVSCNKSIEKVNDISDIQKGKTLANKFYEDLSNNNKENIYKICDEKMDVKKFDTLLHMKDSILGKILNHKFVDVKTRNVITEKDTFIEFFMELEVDYQKGKHVETLNFIKEGNKGEVLQAYNTDPKR